jgi:hypothetical protein
MQRISAQIAVDAVRDAVALLTYDLGLLPDAAPLSDLGGAITTLQQALRRVEVLTLMHPELTMADTLPPGAMPIDEVEEILARGRELETLVTVQPTPTTVTLVTTVPSWAPEEVRYVAAELAGQVVTLKPVDERLPDGRFTVDIGSVLAATVSEAITDRDHDDVDLWSHLDGEDDDDDAPVSSLQLELRRRFGAAS